MWNPSLGILPHIRDIVSRKQLLPEQNPLIHKRLVLIDPNLLVVDVELLKLCAQLVNRERG
jgi:hypothetical protein